MGTIRQLLWDRKARLLTDIAQALELLEGSPWSAIHEQRHGPIDGFLNSSAVFEQLPMLCQSVFGTAPRYQLSRSAPSALPLPGWENLEQGWLLGDPINWVQHYWAIIGGVPQ